MIKVDYLINAAFGCLAALLFIPLGASFIICGAVVAFVCLLGAILLLVVCIAIWIFNVFKDIFTGGDIAYYD